MNKFKELHLEHTRQVGDGVRPATLLNVTGATSSGGSNSNSSSGPSGHWTSMCARTSCWSAVRNENSTFCGLGCAVKSVLGSPTNRDNPGSVWTST